MKTKKTNHSEILNSLKAELETLKSARDSALLAYRNSGSGYEDRDIYLMRTVSKLDNEIKDVEAKIKFHTIMLQDKKYATLWLHSDAHAYEIIEEKSDTTIIVRQMKATIKPEAMVALRKSFVAGGFMGHTDNSLQEWDYETDETQPLETIRKHKDGKWYGCGGSHFTIEAQPHEHYDYNF